MYHIMICDDDAMFLKRMEQSVGRFFESRKTQADIHAFTEIEPLEEKAFSAYDIAILDVDFAGKGYNGLDIARKLRAHRRDTVIIFVTNYIEYAPEGYEIQAFRYVIKSDAPQRLDQYLEQAITRIQSLQKTLQIQSNGELIHLEIERILYMESRKHLVLIHVQDSRHGDKIRIHSVYSTLSSLEKELENSGFLRIQKSYLVNMRHIRKYQCHELILDNDEVLRPSETLYGEQKKKYLHWKGEIHWNV